MKELKIINKNIDDIKEYENNAKEHPDWQIEQIANSIKEFGFNDPIAISLGTYEKIKIITPFVYSNKAEIVRVGLNLKAPYHLTWSCYQGGEKQCGECATCIDRKEAFKKNEAIDPVAYKR